MNDNLDQDLRDLRLAEQDLFKQALDEKKEEIRKLKEENRVLRDLVNSFVVAPRPQTSPSRTPAFPDRRKYVPLRWKNS